MLRRSLPLSLAVTALVAAPASAAEFGTAELIKGATVRADASQVRSCYARLATGRAGVVQRRVTPSANGLLRATLQGSNRTDWDLALFDAATGRNIAGSAFRGTQELAEGAVPAGHAVVVQACRRSGSSDARLRVVHTVLGKPDTYPGRLVRVYTPTQASEDLLHSLPLDLTHGARKGWQDVGIYTAEDEQRLRRTGLTFETLIPNLPAADRAMLFGAEAPGPPDQMPSGRVQYRRLPEFSEDLKSLASENPEFVKPITLKHKSLEGRPIEGIEIARNVHASDGRPIFLQFGVHHAREWPSGEMPMEWAIELVNGLKNKDERITGLLEKTRVIVVPIVNPDGYNLSREATVDSQTPLYDADFAYKRKNCRIVDGAVPGEGECGQPENRTFGTDPNRNYGQFWGGPGAGASVEGETYRGAGPFSEPETQNVRDLISTRQIQTVITNHTYSDLILRPPGLASIGDPPDEAALKALADAMAAENGYTSQKGFDLYDTTGTTEDWSYNATGGFGYTFEIGKASDVSTLVGVGFHPAYPLGVIAEYYGKYPTGGGNRAAYFIALEHTADPKHHSVLEGSAPAGSKITVAKSFITDTYSDETIEASAPPFEDRLETSMAVPEGGKFSYHVNPSTRPITIKKGGAKEAWKLTCTLPDGKVAGRRDVIVDRGETKQLGDVCDGTGVGGAAAVFSVSVKADRRTLRRALSRGLGFSATCSSACTISASLVVNRRTARKLRLGRRAITVAKVRRQAPEGQARLRLKVRGKAARVRKLPVTLRVTATAIDGTRTSRSTRLTLRR